MQTDQTTMNGEPQLRAGAIVSGQYTLTSLSWRYARNGNPYLFAQIQLGAHWLPVFAWPNECDGCESIGEAELVHVMATIEKFHGRYQLRCQRLAAAHARWETKRWTTARLRAIYDWIEPDMLRDFLQLTFNDPVFRHRFLTVPASTRHHHSWPGGLAYHSTEVAWRVFETLSHDRDQQGLATVAALLHDAGKTVTLTEFGSVTNKGQNMSHDAVTLEVLATPLAWLDERWPDGAITLRALLTDNRDNRPERYLRSLLRLQDRKSARLS